MGRNTNGSTIGVQRNYKDTLFRMIFKEKDNLLSLYNAVNDTHYEDTEQLEIVTLENAIFMNMKNDLAFMMDFYLNIYEHQSTVCPNMPLRDLFYVAKELSSLVAPDALYRSKLVKIPTPRFYVFYNGREEQPEQQILRLSDAFCHPTEKPELELKVHMLNINESRNQTLLDKCSLLREYMLFVEKARVHLKDMNLEDAVLLTVNECINEGILADFLRKHKQEAMEVCIFEYNEEKAMQYIKQDEYDRGLEVGERAGYEAGRAELQKSFITNLLRHHTPDAQIRELAECDQSLIDEIKTQL